MSYFQPPVSLKLNQIEEIVYASDRQEALNRLFTPTSHEYHFYSVLFSQLEVESAFDDALPDKIKQSLEYLSAYKKYCQNIARSSTHPGLQAVKAKETVYEFQTLLASLGATNDDIARLELFHTDFTTNYQILSKHLNSVSDRQQRVQLIKELIRTAQFYFNHTKPDGFNQNSSLSHWASYMTGESVSTTIQSWQSNPVEFIYNLLQRDVKRNLRAPLEYEGLNEHAFPYIFLLHHHKIINLQHTDYFMVVSHIFSTMNTVAQYPNVLELLAWFLKLSREVNAAPRDSEYYSLRQYTRTFQSLPCRDIFTYDELITLQKLDPEVSFHIDFIRLLLQKYVPPSFQQLSRSKFTGADDALKYVGESQKEGQHGLLHQPLCLFSKNDVQANADRIPSFVLTAMTVYEKCIEIVNGNLQYVKTQMDCDVNARRTIERYYYSLIASYLGYTAHYNVYRYDILDQLLNGPITFRNHLQYQGHMNLPQATRPLDSTRLESRFFCDVSFDYIIELYVQQYFSLPTSTTTDKFKSQLSATYLAEVLYQTKAKRSGTVIDVTCEYPTTPTLQSDATGDAATTVVGTTQKFTSTVPPEIKSFNVYNVDNVKDIVHDYLYTQSTDHIHIQNRLQSLTSPTVSSPSLSWAPRLANDRDDQNNGYPLLNQQSIDHNGNLRASLLATNASNFTVNVYNIDIFNYYKSQLTSNGNSSSNGQHDNDFDVNIDLEGLVPNYTTKVDLTSYTSNLAICSEYIIHLNLVKLPSRGVFLIEVIHGQEAIRCCCRKGAFTCVTQQTSVGTLAFLLDETGKPVQYPRIYIGTEMFTPDTSSSPTALDTDAMEDLCDEYDITASHVIVLPHYQQNKTLLLTDSSLEFASTHILEGVQEQYSLMCDWFTSTEALTSNCNIDNTTAVATIQGKDFSLKTGDANVLGGGISGAEVIVRPLITMNGKSVSLSDLTIVRSSLRIAVTLHNGVTITDTIDNFRIGGNNDIFSSMSDDNAITVPTLESIHAFAIPENLERIQYDLNVTIANNFGKEYDLEASHSLKVAQINKTNMITGMFVLRKVNGIYMLYSIDKTGHPLPFVPITVQLTRSYLYNGQHDTIHLNTDINGCAELGPLLGISNIRVHGQDPTGDLQQHLLSRINLIHGSFTYDIAPSHQVQWPSMLRLLVRDDDVDESNVQQQELGSVQHPQVVLPLPFDINQNTVLVKLYAALMNTPQDALKLAHTSLKPLFDANSATDLVSDAEYQAVLDYLLTAGRIVLYEVSSGGLSTIRQVCTNDCISIAGNNLMLTGLNPNRRYELRCILDNGSLQFLTINTYRHPHHKKITARPFGQQLPTIVYSDTTLAFVSDYLVTLNGIVKMTKHTGQLSLITTDYNHDNEELTIQLENWTPTTQVAVFANTFLTSIPSFTRAFSSYQQNLQSCSPIATATIATPSSTRTTFVSSAAISGEREYILHRRALLQEMEQVGVMLPTPSLLLNKRLKRYTESIEDQEKKKAKRGHIQHEQREMAEEESASLAKSRQFHRFGAASPALLGSRNYMANDIIHSIVHSPEFYTMDILREKSSVFVNIVPDQSTGSITIRRPGMNAYSNLTIIAYDTSMGNVDTGIDIVTLDVPQPLTRLPYSDRETIQEQKSLDAAYEAPVLQSQQYPFVCNNSFKSSLDPSKRYAEEHQIDIVQPTQQRGQQTGGTVIGPYKSVELDVITSTKDLHSLLTSLHTTGGRQADLLTRTGPTADSSITSRGTIIQGLNKYRFLGEWSTFNDSTKLTYVDRYACHEFHLFIFFNDRPFFEQYLRLHLSNKLQRDIVDLWLLSRPISTKATTLHDNDMVQLFHAIRDECIELLRYYSHQIEQYNIVEKILILSVTDKFALRSAALYMKNDEANNASHHRNSETWVQLFESCLRRRLLVLNTQQDDIDPTQTDQDDDKQPDSEDKDNSEDNDDGDDDDDEGSDSESDESIDEVRQQVQLESSCDNMLDTATIFEACAPPPPPAAPAPRMMMARGGGGAFMKRSVAAPAAASMPGTLSASGIMPTAQPMSMMMAAAPRAAVSQSKNAFHDVASAITKQKPKVIASYKPLEKTGEYEERTWYIDASKDGENYHLETRHLMSWTHFWVDLAFYLCQDDDVIETTPFSSKWIIDLFGGTVNEYLLALAFTQFSPVTLSRTAVMGAVSGKDILASNNYNILGDNDEFNHDQTKKSDHVQPTMLYRVVYSSKFPVLVLHKQLQELQQQGSSADTASSTSVNDNDDDDTTKASMPTLNIAQYYIDVFSSMIRNKYIYVQPNNLIKGRIYLCRVVTSNMTSSSVKSKVLIQIPDNCVSISLNEASIIRNGARISQQNTTHLQYLDSTTVYIDIPAYSSYIISYAFHIGNHQQVTHYGPTVSSSNTTVTKLYCFTPSIDLLCREDVHHVNANDPVAIAANADDDTLCKYLEQHFKLVTTNDAQNNVNDNDDEPTRPFDLSLIFFRFKSAQDGNAKTSSSTPVGSVGHYVRRVTLFTRVIKIAKGYITTYQQNDQSIQELLRYAFYLLQEYYEHHSSLYNFTPEQLSILTYCVGVVLKQHLFTSVFNVQTYSHLEYLPLVAARIHNSSMASTDTKNDINGSNDSGSIPDAQLKEQYTRAVNYALVRASSIEKLEPSHILSLLYYAILLHRKSQVKSLLIHFLNASIKRSQKEQSQPVIDITTRIQLAYILCYIDVSTYGQLLPTLTTEHISFLESIYKVKFTAIPQQKEYQISVALSQAYKNYPIRQWKQLFTQTYRYLQEGLVLAQDNAAKVQQPLSPQGSANVEEEYDLNVAGASALQRDLQQDRAADHTPSLSSRVQYTSTESIVDIYYSNLQDTQLVLDIHFIDSELLLSHKPFMSSSSQGASSSQDDNHITRPHLSLTIPVTPYTTTMTHTQCKIPAKFSTNAHLVIRAVDSHVQSTTSLLHNNFVIQVLSKQGIVRVIDQAGKPIAGAYVKCYAQEGSSGSRFHHDGYTDVRGKFDYASTSQKKVDNDKGNRFALILVHPDYGTTVTYTDKPQE